MNENVVILAEDMDAIIKRNRETGWPDLTDQRKAFAMNYIVHYDYRKAAEDANFSPDMGSKLVREPILSAFVSALQEENTIANLVTEDFIRTQFVNLIPILSGQIDVPIVLPNGDQIEGRKFYAGELVNVLKELAKSTKFYEDGSGGSNNVNVQINLGDLLGENAKGVIIDG